MSRRSLSLLALVVTAAAAVAVGSANAADLPVPASGAYYPPSYAPAIYNWTGLYLGGNVGLSLMDDTDTATTSNGYQNAGTRTDLRDLGWMGGVQFGVNYEFTPVVVGVEGTWSPAYMTASNIIPSLVLANSQRAYANEPWFATVTGRIGYAWDDLLFYGRGGVAWMDVNYRQDDLNFAGAVAFSQQINDVRTGFTAGVGLEYGLTEHWSARIEYNFFDFGTKTYNFNNLSTTTGPIGPFPISINSIVNSITAGINFRFN